MFRTIHPYLAIVAIVAVLAVGISLRLGSNSDADQAWSDRLTAQAQAIQEDAGAQRAADAYSQRLIAQAQAYLAEAAKRQTATQAWTDRLSGLAPDDDSGLSQRASAAWTARLEGLAEHLTSGR